MKHGSTTTWLTCDEVAFLQGLGTYTDGAAKAPRLTWLQRYIEVAVRRVDWGKIDKVAVLKEARRLLRVEQRKRGEGVSAQ